MIKLRKELLELSREFIREGFKDMKARWECNEYKEILAGKNIPDFMIKYFDRYIDKLEAKQVILNILDKTTLDEKQIKSKLINWYTLSNILSLYRK